MTYPMLAWRTVAPYEAAGVTTRDGLTLYKLLRKRLVKVGRVQLLPRDYVTCGVVFWVRG
jgi:hypothetical protein